MLYFNDLPDDENVRMYPRKFPSEYQGHYLRAAEENFYNRLCEQLPKEWIAMYHHRFIDKVFGIVDGEMDFVVIVPSYGILVIELKGGSVRYDGSNQKWYQKFSQGNEKLEKCIDPFAQARKGVHALLSALAGLGVSTDFRIHFAVVFPDVNMEFERLGMEVNRELIIDRHDLSQLVPKIQQILQYSIGSRKSWAEGNRVAELVENELLRSANFEIPLSQEMAYQNSHVKSLTDLQTRVFMGLRNNKRVLVTGCVGSGKTVLAATLAQHLAKNGRKTLLTCSNRALVQHLWRLSDQQKNLDVMTFGTLCRQATEALGHSFLTSVEVYPLFLRQYMHENPDARYDAIIVDEAQDIGHRSWKTLKSCLANPDEGSLFLFSDYELRVRKNSALPAMDVQFELTTNIRNTTDIFEALSGFCLSERYSSEGPPGRPIEALTYDENTLLPTLDSVVSNLVHRQLLKLDDIVILEQSAQRIKDCNLPCGVRLKEFGTSTIGVSFSTIRKFKGLEKPVVILVLDERLRQLSIQDRRWLIYLAMSRASNHLIVLATDQGHQLMHRCRLNM